MKEKEYIKKYIDEAEKELRELFTDLIYDHNDSDGQYELQNLTSGFNTLLEYARKWQESQETGLTAAEAVDALLAGRKSAARYGRRGSTLASIARVMLLTRTATTTTYRSFNARTQQAQSQLIKQELCAQSCV